MNGFLLDSSVVRLGAAGQTAATTAVDGAPLDMTGYDGVVIVARIGTANAGNFLCAQDGDAANLADAADLAGTRITTVANDQIAVLDLQRPQPRRFVRGRIVRAGASTTTGDLIYIPYRADQRPTVVDVVNVVLSRKVLSPARGTP